MKDTETNTNDESSSSSSSNTSRTESRTQSDSPASSSSSSTSRTESETQNDSPAPSEPEKANSEPSNERKIKETGYKLNELTAYPYDLIDVDDNANKSELAMKLDDVIARRNGALPILGGSFFGNGVLLTGLQINKSIKPETKNRISTHSGLIGFFDRNQGIKVENHGKKEDKKYLFKWRLVKLDGSFGPKVYEQIIDLS